MTMIYRPVSSLKYLLICRDELDELRTLVALLPRVKLALLLDRKLATPKR
ncbi:hypothetical protein BGLA2_420121 [Burkholderia gladioli]|nr:hypothetical protein BGLA2_420121 [Burkholderia gladioli]